MKRWIHASTDDALVKRVADECWALLKSNGNGEEVKGLKTNDSYWLYVQETGPGYAIYFDSGNIWEEPDGRAPLYFNSLEAVAEWLINN